MAERESDPQPGRKGENDGHTLGRETENSDADAPQTPPLVEGAGTDHHLHSRASQAASIPPSGSRSRHGGRRAGKRRTREDDHEASPSRRDAARDDSDGGAESDSDDLQHRPHHSPPVDRPIQHLTDKPRPSGMNDSTWPVPYSTKGRDLEHGRLADPVPQGGTLRAHSSKTALDAVKPPDAPKERAFRVKLDLNLEIEIMLKASIHGDLVLSVL